MSTITMYSTATCPYCAQAENLLKRKGFSVNKIRVDQSQEALEEMMNITQKRTVPQIFINQHYVGGFDDLSSIESQGKLDKLLKQ